jgi:hypothetical protein
LLGLSLLSCPSLLPQRRKTMLLLPYFILFVADSSIEVVLPFLGRMLRVLFKRPVR